MSRALAPPWHSPTSSTTGGSSDSQRFRVTHPFHPLSGHEYELVGFAHTWGEHRVFFREPGQTRVRSLPANWTDVGGADAFLVLLVCNTGENGRPFRGKSYTQNGRRR